MGDGALHRVHNLIDSKANGGLKRSRSVAIPFLRSRSQFRTGDRELDNEGITLKNSAGLTRSRSTRWFWSMFKPRKGNRSGVQEQDSECVVGEDEGGSINRKAAMITKSRSVAASGSGVGELRGPKKGKGWYFPGSMKAFRQSNKVPKVLQEAVVCA